MLTNKMFLKLDTNIFKILKKQQNLPENKFCTVTELYIKYIAPIIRSPNTDFK